MLLKCLCQKTIELSRPNHAGEPDCRVTEDGVIQLRHRLGSVGGQLDHAPPLQACHRVGVAQPAQDVPVQQLAGGQDLDGFQLLRSQGSQPKLEQVVELTVRAERTVKLPAVVGVDQDAVFAAGAEQSAQQQQVSAAARV